MVTREELEKIFSKYPLLKPPEYVYILDAPLVIPQLRAIAKGAQYKGTNAIFLTPQSDEETVIHETLHVHGVGEFIAYPLARALKRFRSILPPLIGRRVEYMEYRVPVTELEKYGIRVYPPNIGGNVRLLKLRGGGVG